MTLEELKKEWAKDCIIDQTELASESIKSNELHSKYYNHYCDEKLKLAAMQHKHYRLRRDKFEFYTQGPSKEQRDLGWRMPPKGVIIKTESNIYLDSDTDLGMSQLRLEAQKEKVDFLKDILDEIKNRRWTIRNAIEFLKFISGA